MVDLNRLYGVMDLAMLKSVRIGALSYPASQAEHVLQRYCKHIFVLNDSDAYPYSFRGTPECRTRPPRRSARGRAGGLPPP